MCASGWRRHRLSLQLRSQQADHVVRGDDPGQLFVVIDDRESEQVVLVEQFCNLLFSGAGMTGNQRFLGKGE